jgi:ubiquinone/menaquinone biosynthesis C-methylase UbiE
LASDQAAARSLFDSAAGEYDAARPAYPDALYTELQDRTGPLTGQLIIDCGAGTGIASRQLADRGARVVSLDIGEQMLAKAKLRSPRSACVLADGNRLPVRPAVAGLVTFAQSWHWFDQRLAAAEVARVLTPGGYWAAWWNQTHADGEPWFDEYQQLMGASCPNYWRMHGRDERLVPDWTDEVVAVRGLVEPAGVVVVPWTRRVAAAGWITEQRSKSYVIELEPTARESVLGQAAQILAGSFPDGQLTVAYRTTLLLARKAG